MTNMTTPTTLGRTAGVLYLAVAVLGGWAELVARGSIYVPGDATATATAIVDHESVFRLSLVADVLMATVFVLLGLTLYRLLDDVDRRAATALLVFVSVGAGTVLLNLTFQVGALLTATSTAYDDATTLLLLDLHAWGYLLGGIFFGLWLLPVGWVAVRTPLFPTWLGVLVLVGAGAWVADTVLAVAVPDPGVLRGVTGAATTIAELTLVGYLVVRGVRRPGAVLEPQPVR